jgi:hypothetical protein
MDGNSVNVIILFVLLCIGALAYICAVCWGCIKYHPEIIVVNPVIEPKKEEEPIPEIEQPLNP